MRVRSRFPFRRGRYVQPSRRSTFVHLFIVEVHHILAEIIQGGLVLETNVEEIDSSGSSYFCLMHGMAVYETLNWTGQCPMIRYLSNTPFIVSASSGQSQKRVFHFSKPTITRCRWRSIISKWWATDTTRVVNREDHRRWGSIALIHTFSSGLQRIQYQHNSAGVALCKKSTGADTYFDYLLTPCKLFESTRKWRKLCILL